MTRWRVTYWPVAKPTVKKRVHRQGDCKLCIIDYAMTTIEQVALDNHRTYRDYGWTVEKLTGVVDGWTIVYTNSQQRLTGVKRHAH